MSISTILVFPTPYHMCLYTLCLNLNSGLCEFATLTERKLEKHIILQHENHRPYKVCDPGYIIDIAACLLQ